MSLIGYISLACGGGDHDGPLNSPFWVPGWERTLDHHVLHNADKRQPRASNYRAWAHKLIVNIQTAVREGRPGSEACAFLKTWLSRDYDTGDHSSAITRT